MEEKILNLNEAALLFKVSPETLRRKIHSENLPAYKVGKCWVFIYSDLIKYMRSKYSVESNIYLLSDNEKIKNPTAIKNKHLSVNRYRTTTIEKEYQEALQTY